MNVPQKSEHAGHATNSQDLVLDDLAALLCFLGRRWGDEGLFVRALLEFFLRAAVEHGKKHVGDFNMGQYNAHE